MRKGFTFIELLVVIFITILLTALFVPNYRKNQKQLILQRAANKLAQDIRRAQEMAMSAKRCCGGIIPSGGYGIYFKTDDWPITDDTEYTAFLYADISSDEQESYDSNDEEIETLLLEEGVKIKLVEDTGSSEKRKCFSVNFKPPDPKVNLKRWDPGNRKWSDDGDLKITLSLKGDGGKTKKIIVNKAGLVYVE